MAVLALACALASPARAGSFVTPWITTDGPRFVDGSGQEVALRGFVVNGPHSPSLWRKAAELGANFVRLPVYWNEIEPEAPVGGVHTWNTELLQAIDEEVADLGSRGVNVLIDLHQVDWSPYFRPERSRGLPEWYYADGRFPATEAGLAEAKAAWWTKEASRSKSAYRPYLRMLVKRYRSYPNVMGYEIMNEPQPGELRYTHAATRAIIEWQATIAKAIRLDDSVRTIVFSPRQGGALGLLNADLSPFADLGSVTLDVHLYYTGIDGTGYSEDGEEWAPSWEATHNQESTDYQGTKDAQERVFLWTYQQATAAGIPLIVGEWAAQNADSGLETYQRHVLQVYEKYGASWTRHDLSSNPTFGLLKSDGSFRDAALQIRDELEKAPSSPTAKPALVSAPGIMGTVLDGKKLIALPGDWSGGGLLRFSYQWVRCDSDGTGCTAITGATLPTYRLSADDMGSRVRVRVRAANTLGSRTERSSTTSVVKAAPPENWAAPTISGLTLLGESLETANGTWVGTPTITFKYRWQRCSSSGTNCENILGSAATQKAYLLVAADVGKTIRVKVTAKNAVGSVAYKSRVTDVIDSG